MKPARSRTSTGSLPHGPGERRAVSMVSSSAVSGRTISTSGSDRRRVEEVHAAHPLGAAGARGELDDRQGRGVGGQDGVRRPPRCVELAEQLLLRARSSTTDSSTRSQSARSTRSRVAVTRARAASASACSSPSPPGGRGRPRGGASGLGRLQRPRPEHDVVARLGGDLGDARPHDPGADDPDAFDAHGGVPPTAPRPLPEAAPAPEVASAPVPAPAATSVPSSAPAVGTAAASPDTEPATAALPPVVDAVLARHRAEVTAGPGLAAPARWPGRCPRRFDGSVPGRRGGSHRWPPRPWPRDVATPAPSPPTWRYPRPDRSTTPSAASVGLLTDPTTCPPRARDRPPAVPVDRLVLLLARARRWRRRVDRAGIRRGWPGAGVLHLERDLVGVGPLGHTVRPDDIERFTVPTPSSLSVAVGSTPSPHRPADRHRGARGRRRPSPDPSRWSAAR